VILLIIAFIVVFVVGIMWGIGINVMTSAWRKRRVRKMPAFQRTLDASGYPGAPPPLSNSRTRITQIGGDHYRCKTIQPWDAMECWMSPEQFKGFLRGNAIKYLARCDDKGGMEDIKKAGHYIAKMQEVN